MGMSSLLSPFPTCSHDTRHCADAILSFAQEITLVASVAAPLLDFASTWVQSGSDYEFIIARAFPPTWCSLHRPVLSRPDPVSHWVYSGIDPLEPDGYPVVCHRGCGREHLDPSIPSKTVKIRCILCHSTCEVNATKVNARTTLGRMGIHKVKFPTTRAVTDWSPPKGPTKLVNPTATREAGIREARGRPTMSNPSQARRGRGGIPVQRPQMHSVPRLPSQTLPPPMALTRTMSQTPLRYPHLPLTPHTSHISLPSTPPVQPVQGIHPLPPFSHGSPSTAHPLQLRPPQATAHRQHQAKRQRTRHDLDIPPS